MEHNLQLSKDQGELLDDLTTYKRLIGLLLYLTNTRPDITYDVHTLTQFLDKSRKPHLDGVTRILCYIKEICRIMHIFSLFL